MTTHSWKIVFLVFSLLGSLFIYALFLKCYFPYKQGLQGNARAESLPDEPVSGRNGVLEPVFDRLVLVVIDALRTDFAIGDAAFMPFTQQLLRKGHGVSFAAKTHLPTVTLPRIKAMTTGSIPGFVDVVLNFGSPALTEDNVVTQLHMAAKTLTFFGDDTWLRLFPNLFTRSDPTTSFFVTDYTEVDVNVTRHLSSELQAEDWDVMILHYLGLDHLGHLYAPDPDIFTPKLREMDAVVQQIYTAMSSWGGRRAAMVVCGDHGISDQGGHGGASPEETNVPIIILSPHTTFNPPPEKKKQIQQIDLCPTLSALLGLPIPRNNLGQVVVEALPMNTALEDKVRHLQLNAAQMVPVLEQNIGNLEGDQTYRLYQDALAAHTSWLSLSNSSSRAAWEIIGNRVLLGYQDAIHRMSQRVGQTSTSYDMYGIVVAIVCLWINFLTQCLAFMHKDATTSLRVGTESAMVILPIMAVAILSHVTICTSQHASDILCGTSVISLVVQLGTFSILIASSLQLGKLLPAAFFSLRRDKRAWSMWDWVLTGSLCLHAVSLLASSFVEEEHQTWYFLSSSFHTLLLILPVSRRRDSSTPAPSSQSCDYNPSASHQNPFSLSAQPCNQKPTNAETQCQMSIYSTCKTSSSYEHESVSPVSQHQNSSSARSLKIDLSRRKKNLHDVDREMLPCEADSLKTKNIFDNETCVGRTNKALDNEEHAHHANKAHDTGHDRERVSGTTGQGEGVRCVAGLCTMLVLGRVMRRWNQTGNKWLDEADVGDWLVRPENKTSLSVLVAVSLGVVLVTRGCVADRTKSSLLLAALTLVYLAKAAAGSLALPDALTVFMSDKGVIEARCAYFFILALLLHYIKWRHPTPSTCHHAQSLSSANLNTKPSSLNTPPSSSANLNTPPSSSANLNTPPSSSANQRSSLSISTNRLASHNSAFSKNGNESQTTHSTGDDSPDVLTAAVMRDRHKGVWEGVQAMWLCVMCLLLRPHNVALVAMTSVMERLACRFVISLVSVRSSSLFLYCWMMGQAAFFFQGNSNSLSTVDVASGLTALYDYQPVLIGLQISVATYAAPLFWCLTACKYVALTAPLHHYQHRLSEAFTELCSTGLLTRALPLSVFTVLVTAMRYHLFVWTVFSPKLLYEGYLLLLISVFSMLCLTMTYFLRKRSKDKL